MSHMSHVASYMHHVLRISESCHIPQRSRTDRHDGTREAAIIEAALAMRAMCAMCNASCDSTAASHITQCVSICSTLQCAMVH